MRVPVRTTALRKYSRMSASGRVVVRFFARRREESPILAMFGKGGSYATALQGAARTDARVHPLCPVAIGNATETERGTAIKPRPHQQKFHGEVALLYAAIGVPFSGAVQVGLEPCAAPQNGKACAPIVALTFRPFPHVSAHVIAAER
jgi:hypothetical protein